MEVRGDTADLDDDMQVDGARRVVYVLHPNCNVEGILGVSEVTQLMDH